MAEPQLVQIPWQQALWLRPQTLSLLDLASDYANETLQVTSPDGAWRPYAVQRKYRLAYLAWLAYQAGRGPKVPYAPYAADPDVGQRAHPRGAAFDLAYQTPARRAACIRAGLLPDGSELWHFNHPNWQNMPVILTNFQTSSTGYKPVGTATDKKEYDVDAYTIIRDTAPEIAGDFIQRNSDGAIAFFKGYDHGNELSVRFGIKSPLALQAEGDAFREQTNRALIVMGLQVDKGQLSRNPGIWTPQRNTTMALPKP